MNILSFPIQCSGEETVLPVLACADLSDEGYIGDYIDNLLVSGLEHVEGIAAILQEFRLN
ncbi:hypothetical protein PDENDC454_19413, partial [Paenibacillus dendritiformis C454]